MSENDTTGPAPGWYPDGHGEQRWWDGARWTDRTLPPPGAAMPATAPGPATGGRRRTKPLLVGLLVVGVVALLALIVLNVFLLAA